jgi:Protein of unknown function (DUF2971)
MNHPENMICHYTSVEALIQMVANNDTFEMQASHIASFEDIDEGRPLEDDTLKVLIGHANHFDQVNSIYPPIAGEITNHIQVLRTKQIQREIYILSFSRKVDFLPMWRLYASGGSGLCIVFDGVALAKKVADLGGNMTLIDYTKDYWTAFKDTRRNFLDIASHGSFLKSSSFYNEQAATREHILRWFENEANGIQSLSDRYSTRIKNEAFAFEEEVRAVFQQPAIKDLEVIFRGGTRAPIARLKVCFTAEEVPTIIKKVVMAPGLDALSPSATERIKSLISTFKSHSLIFKDIEFEQSAIPFYSSYGR